MLRWRLDSIERDGGLVYVHTCDIITRDDPNFDMDILLLHGWTLGTCTVTSSSIRNQADKDKVRAIHLEVDATKQAQQRTFSDRYTVTSKHGLQG